VSETAIRIVLTSIIIWLCVVVTIGIFFTERNSYTTGGGRLYGELTCEDVRPYHDAVQTWEAAESHWTKWLAGEIPSPTRPFPPGVQPSWNSFRPMFAPAYDDDWREICSRGSDSTILVESSIPPPVVRHTEWIWPKTEWLISTGLAVLATFAVVALRAVWSGGTADPETSGSPDNE